MYTRVSVCLCTYLPIYVSIQCSQIPTFRKLNTSSNFQYYAMVPNIQRPCFFESNDLEMNLILKFNNVNSF